MLSVFIWIEFQAIGNLSIGEFCHTLTRFRIPQFNKSIIRASDELFAIAGEIECTDTLNFSFTRVILIQINNFLYQNVAKKFGYK